MSTIRGDRTFRWAVGLFCLVAGAIFLAINSLILYRGAYKFGHDEVDKIAFGIAAAVVPWVIAIMPSLVTESWRTTLFGLRRPSATTLAVIMAWVVFIAYNLSTGAGVIAASRLETVADRDQYGSAIRAKQDRRITLRAQLAGIPSHRPTETVEREIAAVKVPKAYANSAGCADPRTVDQRKLCGDLNRLEAELASGRAAADINRQIAALDAELAIAKPVVASSDPQADLLQNLTGAEKSKIQLWLPAATPIVLEIGAGLMWHFGFAVLGIRLRRQQQSLEQMPIAGSQEAVQAVFNPAPLMSPAMARVVPDASLEALTARRKLAEWFFSNCARPVSAGSMPEAEWYEHYQDICRRSGDTPIPIDTFRRIAMRYMPRISEVDGVTHYFEMLPVIPQAA